MQAAIGHNDFFSPHLDAAIPPMMPPTVRAATPMVPYTSQAVDVDNARPPYSAEESGDGFTILSKHASVRRY